MEEEDAAKWKKKPGIKCPQWKFSLFNDYRQRDQDQVIRFLNQALDEAMKIVDTAVKTREKLGDDNKWAAELTEHLTSHPDPLIKEIIDNKSSGFKAEVSSAIVVYLTTVRKLLFEAA